MKLWLLKAKQGADPWIPWYDKAFGFVVRAETEAQARQIADENAGQENEKFWDSFGVLEKITHPWLDAQLSTCEELTADGEAGMILQDLHMA